MVLKRVIDNHAKVLKMVRNGTPLIVARLKVYGYNVNKLWKLEREKKHKEEKQW